MAISQSGRWPQGRSTCFRRPAQMKKNRPGLLVTILCEPENVPQLIDLVFRETTTIGVRTYEVRRKTLERESVPVETEFGAVHVKLSRMNGSLLNATPEYEDCQRIAARARRAAEAGDCRGCRSSSKDGTRSTNNLWDKPKILPDHADLLCEFAAARGLRVHDDRVRRDRALQADVRLRRGLSHRHR